MPLRTIATTSLLLALLATAAPARADPAKTVEIPALQTLVSGLGLEDVGDKTNFVAVKITSPGGYGYTISFIPSNDKSFMTIYSRLQVVPKERMVQMPMLKMLQYNDSHLFFFSVASDKDGGGTSILNGTLAATAVSPQNLRRYIDLLVADADETAEVWDSDKWVTGNGAKKSSN